MIAKHRATGVSYRIICDSFDVATQEHHFVYVSLATGQIFNRSQAKFFENFNVDIVNPQHDIIPKEPHK